MIINLDSINNFKEIMDITFNMLEYYQNKFDDELGEFLSNLHPNMQIITYYKNYSSNENLMINLGIDINELKKDEYLFLHKNINNLTEKYYNAFTTPNEMYFEDSIFIFTHSRIFNSFLDIVLHYKKVKNNFDLLNKTNHNWGIINKFIIASFISTTRHETRHSYQNNYLRSIGGGKAILFNTTYEKYNFKNQRITPSEIDAYKTGNFILNEFTSEKETQNPINKLKDVFSPMFEEFYKKGPLYQNDLFMHVYDKAEELIDNGVLKPKYIQIFVNHYIYDLIQSNPEQFSNIEIYGHKNKRLEIPDDGIYNTSYENKILKQSKYSKYLFKPKYIREQLEKGRLYALNETYSEWKYLNENKKYEITKFALDKSIFKNVIKYSGKDFINRLLHKHND